MWRPESATRSRSIGILQLLAPLAALQLLVHAQLASAAPARPPPVVANPPRWGWATLGDMAFFHAGDPQPYSPGDLALIKRFPIVQFDKKQGLATMPGASTEERARGTTWQDVVCHTLPCRRRAAAGE